MLFFLLARIKKSVQNNFIHKRKSSNGQDIYKCYKQKRRVSLLRGCHSPWQSDNVAIQCEVCIQLNWKGKGKNVKYDSHHQISPGVVCSHPPAHHNLSQKVEASKKPVHLYETASHYIEGYYATWYFIFLQNPSQLLKNLWKHHIVPKN